MKVEITESALADLEHGADFYLGAGGLALANRFVDDFERCLGLIASHPEIGSRWVASSRRLPLRQFPYSVVYRIDPEFVLILAVAHHRRDPTDIEKGLPT